jgi:hypothetical protein
MEDGLAGFNQAGSVRSRPLPDVSIFPPLFLTPPAARPILLDWSTSLTGLSPQAEAHRSGRFLAWRGRQETCQFCPEFLTRPAAVPTATPIPRPKAKPTSLPTAAPTPSPTPPPAATPEPGIEHVVIITIDGLRPDALFAADAPVLDELINKGSYCPTAQTVTASITLPSHASMLSGMLPQKHGVLWNAPYIGWPGMTGPTLFNVAREAGLSTAMVFGKQKMNYLVLPHSVDRLFGVDASDLQVKDKAVEFIEAGLPTVLFVHFPDTDRTGHIFGWMSPNQLTSITYADAMVGELLAALEAGGYLPNTLLIITADHGGHGFWHGDDSPEDRTIPWLAGVTLYRPINTYDTAATVLYALDLPIPEQWDGRPVVEIFGE